MNWRSTVLGLQQDLLAGVERLVWVAPKGVDPGE
jgi:hypothetical protein